MKCSDITCFSNSHGCCYFPNKFIGFFELNGLVANVTFFKGLFDKMEIEPQIFRVGTYKSYVEPFFRKDMSEANREQKSSFVNDIYDYYLRNVSVSRNIDFEKFGSSPLNCSSSASCLNLL